MESLRLEKTPKITQSKHQPIPIMPTDHVPQCHIHTVLEHLHGRWLHHLPGQPVPLQHRSFWEEIFLYIQPELNFLISILAEYGAEANVCQWQMQSRGFPLPEPPVSKLGSCKAPQPLHTTASSPELEAHIAWTTTHHSFALGRQMLLRPPAGTERGPSRRKSRCR